MLKSPFLSGIVSTMIEWVANVDLGAFSIKAKSAEVTDEITDASTDPTLATVKYVKGKLKVGTSLLWVDCTVGNDTTGDGSYLKPYKNYEKAVTVANAIANDVAVILLPGVYARTDTQTWTSGYSLTMIGVGEVTLTYNGVVIDNKGTNNVKIDHIYLNGGSGEGQGVFESNTDISVHVKNCKIINGAGDSLIKTRPGQNDKFENCDLTAARFYYDCSLTGKKTLIKNCNLHLTQGFYRDPATQSLELTLDGNVTGFVPPPAPIAIVYMTSSDMLANASTVAGSTITAALDWLKNNASITAGDGLQLIGNVMSALKDPKAGNQMEISPAGLYVAATAGKDNFVQLLDVKVKSLVGQIGKYISVVDDAGTPRLDVVSLGNAVAGVIVTDEVVTGPDGGPWVLNSPAVMQSVTLKYGAASLNRGVDFTHTDATHVTAIGSATGVKAADLKASYIKEI